MKFTWVPMSMLIGVLVLTSILSIPVQAKSLTGDVQQNSDPAGKPPTKTKRVKPTTVVKTSVPKSTPIPKTSTPKPTNTLVSLTNTVIASGTPMGTGTPADTATALPTYTFSSEINTVVAQLTATSGAVYMTSTSMALTASSTPTSIGAPTSTPNNLEQTATSIVLTTAPIQPTLTISAAAADPSVADQQIPVTSGTPTATKVPGKMFWVLVIGLLIFFILLYLLSKELKKSSNKGK